MITMAIEKQKMGREGKSGNFLSGRQSLEEDGEIREPFTGYFRRKMALVLLLIRSQDRSFEKRQVEKAVRFLDDLYRHLSRGGSRKKYRRVFRWLTCFFACRRDETLSRGVKAEKLVRLIEDEVVLRYKMTPGDEVW